MEYLKEHPEEFEIDEKLIEEQSIRLDERKAIFKEIKKSLKKDKKISTNQVLY